MLANLELYKSHGTASVWTVHHSWFLVLSQQKEQAENFQYIYTVNSKTLWWLYHGFHGIIIFQSKIINLWSGESEAHSPFSCFNLRSWRGELSWTSGGYLGESTSGLHQPIVCTFPGLWWPIILCRIWHIH